MPNNLPTSFAFWYPKSSAVSGVVNGSKTTSIPITIIPIPIAERDYLGRCHKVE